MKGFFAKIMDFCSLKVKKPASKVSSIVSNTHSAGLIASSKEAETLVETKPYESLRCRTPPCYLTLANTSQEASNTRANDNSDASASTLAADLLLPLAPTTSKNSPDHSASKYTMSVYSQGMLTMQQSTTGAVPAPDNGILPDPAPAEKARGALRHKSSKTDPRSQGPWPIPRASDADTTSNEVNQVEDVLLAQDVYDCEDLDFNGNPFLTLVTLKTSNDQAQ